METSDIRRALFGRKDRTHAYLVQSWTVREGRPVIWRSRVAYTLAGANRVRQSKWLTDDIRSDEVWTSVLRVEEVDTQLHTTTQRKQR